MKLKYNILTQEFIDRLRWFDTAVAASESIPKPIKDQVRSISNEIRQSKVYMNEVLANIVYRNSVKSTDGRPFTRGDDKYVINEKAAKEAQCALLYGRDLAFCVYPCFHSVYFLVWSDALMPQ